MVAKARVVVSEGRGFAFVTIAFEGASIQQLRKAMALDAAARALVSKALRFAPGPRSADVPTTVIDLESMPIGRFW